MFKTWFTSVRVFALGTLLLGAFAAFADPITTTSYDPLTDPAYLLWLASRIGVPGG